MLKQMVSPLVLALALTGSGWAATDQPQSSSMGSDQQQAAGPGSGSSGSMGQSGSTAIGGANDLTANQVLDMNVQSANGEQIGSVENLVIDPSGRVSGVVVSVGGFLGIGDKKVALPWSQVSLAPDQKNLTTSATKQELQQAVAWQDTSSQTAARPPSGSSGGTSGTATPRSGTTDR